MSETNEDAFSSSEVKITETEKQIAAMEKSINQIAQAIVSAQNLPECSTECATQNGDGLCQNLVEEESIAVDKIAITSEILNDEIEKTISELSNELNIETNNTVENALNVPIDENSALDQNDTNVDNLPNENSDDAINVVIQDIITALQTSLTDDAENPPKEVPQSSENIKCEDHISKEEWSKRENELLEKISSIQEEESIKREALQIKLKAKCDENEMAKAKLKTLELELRAVCLNPTGKNKDMVSKIKKQHEELLTKARGMIFEKTKMIKNQELQIEALHAQVSSLKEVVAVTKDLLNIRNLEVAHLQERLESMDDKIKTQRERQDFLVNKLDTGTKLNEELKKEYEKQMELFKMLKQKYEEKFQVLERNQKPPPEEIIPQE